MVVPNETLPNREDLKFAISPWWRGGRTAETIIDVLRSAAASADEARTLAESLSSVADRLSVITRQVVEDELERLRAAASGPRRRSEFSDAEVKRKMESAINDVATRLSRLRGCDRKDVMPAIVSTYRDNLELSRGTAQEEYWQQMIDVARALPGGMFA